MVPTLAARARAREPFSQEPSGSPSGGREILIAFLGSAHDRFMVIADPWYMSTTRSHGAVMRRSIAVLVVVVAGLGLSGCGDDKSQDAKPSGKGPTAQGGPGHEGASPVAENARHVRVTARSFAFEPKQITVRAGEDIAILLSSEDGLHDFTIDELDAHVAAERGSASVGGFRADKPSRYTFYCSVQGHRQAGMEGTLVVEG